jgi:1-deoxy-D-xylulose-5-phosphate synthase
MMREGSTVAILSLGTRLADAMAAATELASFGLSTSVADMRFAKPIDLDLLRQLARHHEVLITVEEGSIGGFSSQVLHALATEGLLDSGLKVRPMVLPDRFIEHGAPAVQYEDAALSSRQITATALAALGRADVRTLPALA